MSADTRLHRPEPKGTLMETTQQKNLGYDDTPIIPGTRFKVHDGTRPQPRIVRPGAPSTPESPGQPPADAVVLFDGRDLAKWTGRDGEARWKVSTVSKGALLAGG